MTDAELTSDTKKHTSVEGWIAHMRELKENARKELTDLTEKTYTRAAELKQYADEDLDYFSKQLVEADQIASRFLRRMFHSMANTHVGREALHEEERAKREMLILGEEIITEAVKFQRSFLPDHPLTKTQNTFGGLPKAEDRIDLAEVIEATEKERQRRMAEDAPTPAAIRKFRQDLDRHLAIMAEEEERQRRINEFKAVLEKENHERIAAHIGAVIDEENERKRRMGTDQDE